MNKPFSEVMTEARKRQDLTQDDLSLRTFTSRSTIAGYETGRRGMPDELVRDVTQNLDDPELYFSAWRHVGGDVSIPIMNGINVDAYSSSMVFLVLKETKEALEHVEDMPWHLPASKRSTEVVEDTIMELLDAVASMMNLVVCLCRENNITMSRIFRKWQLSMKNRGYQQ